MSISILFPEKDSVLSFLTETQKRYIAAEDERAAFVGGDFDYLNLVRRGEDHSFPEPHRFLWTAAEGADEYRVEVTRRGGGTVALKTAGTECPVPYLFTGCGYAVRVKAFSGGALLDQSPEVPFSTAEEAPRFIRLPGVTNVRDCGGWRTADGRRLAQGKIFRGSEFDSHCCIEPDGVRVLLEEMHLKTDMDMRGEADPAAPGPLDGFGVVRKLIPLSAYQGILQESGRDSMRRFFGALCDPANYPCYLHCWGGADRTGCVVFLLQAVLGVAESDLILDYELTTMSVWDVRYRRFPKFEGFLAELRERFGADGADVGVQARRFLLWAGITEAQLKTLAENMLTD